MRETTLKIAAAALGAPAERGSFAAAISEASKDGVEAYELPQDCGGCVRKNADMPVLMNALSGADGLFCVGAARGAEQTLARAAKALDRPVLLWSPRSVGSGVLMAYGAALAEADVPFSFIISSKPEDEVFTKGLSDFLAACRAVRAMRGIRVLAVGDDRDRCARDVADYGASFSASATRLSAADFALQTESIRDNQGADWAATRALIMRKLDCMRVPQDVPGRMAALKLAVMYLCKRYACQAAAVDCAAVAPLIGLSPCAVFGLLLDEGLPVACDFDIPAVLSMALLSEVCGASAPVFAGEIALTHPQRQDAFLFRNCGAFPPSLSAEGQTPPVCANAFLCDGLPGCGAWRLRDGRATLCRLGVSQKGASLAAFEADACDGPADAGTYAYFASPAWPAAEESFVRGGYLSRFAAIFGGASSALRETCRFIPGLRFEGFGRA